MSTETFDIAGTENVLSKGELFFLRTILRTEAVEAAIREAMVGFVDFVRERGEPAATVESVKTTLVYKAYLSLVARGVTA